MFNLDRLLDSKYTNEELKEILSDFKIGQKVKFRDRHLEWLKHNSYEMHTIGGTTDNGVVMKKTAEHSLFIDLYLGNGFPYKAEIVEFLGDVGDGPGAKIKITLPNKMSIVSIVFVLDFK